MTILPSIDILENCFNFNNSAFSKKAFDVVFNESNKICFTKKYIELLEKSISNENAFSALIVELNDSGRIIIESTFVKNGLREEFIEISQNSKLPNLRSIVFDDNTNLKDVIPNLTIVCNSSPINRHWINLELLSKNYCNVCYQHFNNDKEINDFFDSVFSFYRSINEITIFDREQNPYFFSKIKGHSIKFYTVLKGGYKNEYQLIPIKKELQKALGGKLKLFYTHSNRMIHERKVIMEDLLITVDNSFNNVTVNEQTWEIIITRDLQKAVKWKEKCSSFREIRN